MPVCANYRGAVSSVRHQPHRPAAQRGTTPAYDVVTLTVALLLTATVVDLTLSDRPGLLFDLAFVSLCVAAALTVRVEDLFDVGVLPPLALLLVVVLLAISDPGSVARPTDGVVQATVTGLSGHALALALGYAACLGLLATRRSVLERAGTT